MLLKGERDLDCMYSNRSLERFEDTKRAIRSRKSKKDRQYNGQTKKDNRTNNYLQNISEKTKDRATRTGTKNWGWNQMPRKGKQFLLHTWHPSCYSCYKPGDKSWMRKWPDIDYDKRNISFVTQILHNDYPSRGCHGQRATEWSDYLLHQTTGMIWLSDPAGNGKDWDIAIPCSFKTANNTRLSIVHFKFLANVLYNPGQIQKSILLSIFVSHFITWCKYSLLCYIYNRQQNPWHTQYGFISNLRFDQTIFQPLHHVM